MAATIHIPDATLDAKLAAWETNALKCVLIDISTYDRTTDSVLSNLTEVVRRSVSGVRRRVLRGISDKQQAASGHCIKRAELRSTGLMIIST